MAALSLWCLSKRSSWSRSEVMAFLGRAILIVLLALVAEPERASADTAPMAAETGVKTVSVEEYRGHLRELRGLVAACRVDPAACDPERVGLADRVEAAGKDSTFEVHWGWLWDAVMKAKNAKAADRETLLDAVEARLAEQASEGGEWPEQAPVIPFDSARANADRVLARAEFKHVAKNFFWEELLGKLFSWLSRVFGGVSTLGHKNPWLGPLVEGGIVVVALAGLLAWVRRVMARQRLAVGMESPAAQAKWKETARSWATLAEAAAAEGAWRDAVHSLYWASVTELEGQRVWRQNNARTPREYLRLVPPDAPQYAPLRVLTQLAERIWYGLAAAEKSDYEQALAVYDELRSA